jgi:hypothetical protein
MSLVVHVACISGEKVKVKLAVCLITCDITKSCQGVEIQLCIFVNTAVNGSKWQLLAELPFLHSGQGRNVCFCQQLNPYFSIIEPIV